MATKFSVKKRAFISETSHREFPPEYLKPQQYQLSHHSKKAPAYHKPALYEGCFAVTVH